MFRCSNLQPHHAYHDNANSKPYEIWQRGGLSSSAVISVKNCQPEGLRMSQLSHVPSVWRADHNIAKRAHQTQPVAFPHLSINHSHAPSSYNYVLGISRSVRASALTSAACSTNPRQTKGRITERKRICRGGGVLSTVERSFRGSSTRLGDNTFP